jgi:hypothetical protein
MKNFILLLILCFTNKVVIGQIGANKRFVTTIEKDTLYWHTNDTLSVLVLHRSNDSREDLLKFRESKPSRKIQTIKFVDNLCGILCQTSIGHAYFFLQRTGITWKIITIRSWNEYMTSVDPSDISSISLDAVNQVTVTKMGNRAEVISFDNDGKFTVIKKKE